MPEEVRDTGHGEFQLDGRLRFGYGMVHDRHILFAVTYVLVQTHAFPRILDGDGSITFHEVLLDN